MARKNCWESVFNPSGLMLMRGYSCFVVMNVTLYSGKRSKDSTHAKDSKNKAGYL